MTKIVMGTRIVRRDGGGGLKAVIIYIRSIWAYFSAPVGKFRVIMILLLLFLTVIVGKAQEVAFHLNFGGSEAVPQMSLGRFSVGL